MLPFSLGIYKMLGKLAGNLAGTFGGTALGGKAGSAIGTTLGLAAGGPVGAAVGGALGTAIGGFAGGTIGGDVGKELLGKKKQRMAGEMFQYSPLAMAGLMEGMQQVNPNTQGLGLVDPNQGHNLPFVNYLVDPNPQQNPYAMY